MIRHSFKVTLLGAGLAVWGCSFPSSAATVNVQVGSGGFVFTPNTTNIAVNDRVLWTWAGSPHNVTSTNGAWPASPTQGAGATFTNTFTSAGTFFYYCTIHGTPTSGMKGAIVVTAANVPPTVAITNPVSGSVFAAPANVTIRASASDADGTVTNVQFLVNSGVLTNETAAPFSATTNNLAAGSYTFSVIAADNGGAKATNAVTISVVTPVPILLSAPASLPAAGFRFSFTANAGLNYVVQRSTNLLSADWVPLGTNQAGSGSVNFTDLNATVNPGFYRVGRMPNP